MEIEIGWRLFTIGILLAMVLFCYSGVVQARREFINQKLSEENKSDAEKYWDEKTS
jgi:hypothetical protein